MKKTINRALPIRSPLSLLSLRIGLPLLASAFALTASLSSSASEFGAHEHGIANLAIAQEGKEVSVSFSAAADSVLGYEHPPTNDQEHTSLAHAKEVFSHPERWLALPASCVLESKDVDLPFMAEAGHENHDHDHDEEAHDDHDHGHDEEAHDDHDHDHDEEVHDDHDHDEGEHDHDGHDHSTHVNVEARYTFHCDSDALSPATLKLFSQLPYLELLRIEAISERTVVVSEQEGDGNLEW